MSFSARYLLKVEGPSLLTGSLEDMQHQCKDSDLMKHHDQKMRMWIAAKRLKFSNSTECSYKYEVLFTLFDKYLLRFNRLVWVTISLNKPISPCLLSHNEQEEDLTMIKSRSLITPKEHDVGMAKILLWYKSYKIYQCKNSEIDPPRHQCFKQFVWLCHASVKN